MAKSWKIRGYDSDTLLFERRVPEETMSEDDIVGLLRCLASSALTDEEVVSAILDGDGRLEIRRDTTGGPDFVTEGNPYYTAERR
ncbi:MAG: hypothetical protein WD341_08755 [Tistlia sp.]|uniref:hypothetical protein n=1 Tax=Tistlia sp. TaxID=3057121 RepID=UPI0034A2BD30